MIDLQTLLTIIGVTLATLFAIISLVDKRREEQSKRLEVQIQRSTSDLRDMREQMYREYAAKDAAVALALKDLDTRLQIEFNGIIANQNKDRELFQHALDRLEVRQMTNIQDVARLSRKEH